MNNLNQIAIRNTKSALSILEQKCYTNVQHITTENYTFPVIIVNLQSKIFFGTNTTCMAAVKPKINDIAEIINIL